MLENIFFILLCNFLIITSFLVISTRNPVVSMLYLILVFLQASLIFLCLGGEFLFILFLVVYVGAIAILFLFVIMLLNLRVVENYNMFYNYMPIGLFVGILFAFFLINFILIDFSLPWITNPLLLDSYVGS
jgi:NADH-quinone oxidoreductase subunit J